MMFMMALTAYPPGQTRKRTNLQINKYDHLVQILEDD